MAAPLALLAGCGSGGGGGVNSTPTPTTTTTSTTTTTTTTPVVPVVNYNDAEYQRSNGATDAGAITAYNAGASGAGVTVAVVDSGLAAVGTEFTGRISSASRAFGGNSDYTDTNGHGTAVSAVIAAARNGSDIQGIAFGATIMALRADTSGSCGTTDGCKFSDSSITSAVDTARLNGARVINLSLGGEGASSALATAVARATAAGIVVVVAAGNEGASSPTAFAQVLAGQSNLVVIAGAHDAPDPHNSTVALSSFSDKAGTYANSYLTALGTGVRSFDAAGTDFFYSGTSFASPAIAAAVALIEQAFPNLTPAQVVSLLYQSATDAGAAGVDSTFGRGLLNIARAFQPIGPTSLAGGQVAVTAADASTLSTAMGDAGLTAASAGQAIILDSYGRAFDMTLAARTRRTAIARPLRDGLRGDLATRSTDFGRFAMTTTIATRFADEPWTGLAQRGLAANEQRLRPQSGMLVGGIGKTLRTGFAFGQSAATLAARVDGAADGGSFLSALAPDATTGFVHRPALAAAMAHRLGGVALLADAEQGRIDATDPTDTARATYAQMRMGLGRRVGALDLAVRFGTLSERRTLLGARLAPALGGSGAVTRFIDMDARFDLGGGWALNGAVRRGWTHGRAGGTLDSARLTSMASSLGLSRERGDNRFGLRFALPTRVVGGGLGLIVPTSYDYDTGAIGYSARFVSLAPTGRESDVEANYGLRVAGGWLESNLFWRRQPGNIAAAPDDLGAGMRYNLTF